MEGTPRRSRRAQDRPREGTVRRGVRRSAERLAYSPPGGKRRGGRARRRDGSPAGRSARDKPGASISLPRRSPIGRGPDGARKLYRQRARLAGGPHRTASGGSPRFSGCARRRNRGAGDVPGGSLRAARLGQRRVAWPRGSDSESARPAPTSETSPRRLPLRISSRSVERGGKYSSGVVESQRVDSRSPRPHFPAHRARCRANAVRCRPASLPRSPVAGPARRPRLPWQPPSGNGGGRGRTILPPPGREFPIGSRDAGRLPRSLAGVSL